MKTQTDSKKQYAKIVLIISCVFAVIRKCFDYCYNMWFSAIC